MRNTRLSGLLIWIAICAFFALIFLFILLPVHTWAVNNDVALQRAQDEASRLNTSIDRLTLEHASLASEDAFEDVWRAKTIGEATAKVQAGLGDLTRQQGVSLRSISPLQSPDMPLMAAVAFRIEAEATLDQVVGLSRLIEFNAPILMVERAILRRLARSNPNSTQPSVFIQLDIVAPVTLDEDGS